MRSEIIVCAANKYGDLILCGARHWDMLMHAQADAIGNLKVRALRKEHGEKQGFVNNFGEFRTRKEAREIVRLNGQNFDLKQNGGDDSTLFSEGLY